MRVLIVGGVAGGAALATRLRRLREDFEIIMFERGQYVSYANCGLPYHIGGVIEDENSLLVANPELLKKRFNIDVRVNTCVTRIDAEKREVEVQDPRGRKKEQYDALVLAPGARPRIPSIEGIENEGIFTLRDIPDMRKIMEYLRKRNPVSALVAGGGAIGLEMTENLAKRGLKVFLVEMAEQVMPRFDPEMAAIVHNHLREKGVFLHTGERIIAFEKKNDGAIEAKLESGALLEAGIVIIATGVVPESELAREAGIALGNHNGILVDREMRTDRKRIWAVGDAVEVMDAITGERVPFQLAGLAAAQARIAADSIVRELTGSGSTADPADAESWSSWFPRQFRGAQGTCVTKVFDLTLAATGASEKKLDEVFGDRGEKPYEKIYVHPLQHVKYFPGASEITIKLLFSKENGRVLGAQAIGREGVERRIDVISLAIQMRATVFDLERAELCYAPQFGSPKDPVNIAGMVAVNHLTGLVPLVHWTQLEEKKEEVLLLDVREPAELLSPPGPEALNIPLGQLREKLRELPADREIWVFCGMGQRSYYACRILIQNGFDAKNLSGGARMYRAWLSLASGNKKKSGGGCL